jgi:hypothetical protein
VLSIGPRRGGAWLWFTQTGHNHPNRASAMSFCARIQK